MRPHRRKDKSRAPGKMFPPTPSLPIQPENRNAGQSNLSPHFGPGAGPQMIPAYGNMFITPPVQFQPAMYQQSPLSPTAQDVEVIRRANILLEAVKNVWGDSSSEADSSDEEEATAPTSFDATNTVLPSVEDSPLGLPSAVPIYLAPPSVAPTRPPRQGHIIRFDKNAGKLPTPPSDASPTQKLSVPDPPPHRGPAPNTPGIPQYLPSPYSALASKPPTSRNFSRHPPPPMSSPPPVMDGFKPINPNGITYISPNHTQQSYPFLPPMTDLSSNQRSQAPTLPMDPRSKQHLQPPALPMNGRNGPAAQATPPSQYQAPPIHPPVQEQMPSLPPKNGTVVRLNDPGPAKEHPRQKPPKNGTLIDFGKPAKPYKSNPRKRKA